MLKKIDAKLLRLIYITLGIVILLLLIALLIGLTKKERLDYVGVEAKMVSAAKNYYKDNDAYLPRIDGNSTEVSLDTLVKDGYMKDPGTYLSNKNLSCIGRVTVTKNNTDYSYYSYLNCGKDYETSYLANEIKNKVVTSSDGVYKIEEYTPSNGTKKLTTNYVYRGEYVNNNILINNKKWRIVKIDGNDNIVVIYDDKDPNQDLYGVWDDRYNSEKEANYGINDYIVSRAKENLLKIYNGEFFDSNTKSKFLSHSVCIGKRSDDDTSTNGSVECSRVLDNQYLSLLPVYDYINASLDTNCKKATDQACSNYNYLNTYSSSWWLATASNEKSYLVYKTSSDGVRTSSAYNSGRFRMVALLDGKTIISGGSGTDTDPYILK